MRKHLFKKVLAIVTAATGGLTVAGCGGPQTGSASSSAVAISVRGQSSANAWVQVTAVDQATGQAAAVESAEVKAGGTGQLVLHLAPDAYRFDLSAFADASEQQAIAKGSAQADVAAGATTVLQLALPDASANGGSTGASGSGTITLTAQAAPSIDGIQVSGGGSAAGSANGSLDGGGQVSGNLAGATQAVVSIAALDQNIDASGDVIGSTSGGLRFFWSGPSIGVGAAGGQGSIEGGSTLTLDASAIANAALQGSLGTTGSVGASVGTDAQHTFHVVVQDAEGAARSAEVDLDTTLNGAVATFNSYSASVEGKGQAAIERVAACHEAHASCVASCNASAMANASNDGGTVTADASCLGNCGLTLAKCEAQ